MRLESVPENCPAIPMKIAHRIAIVSKSEMGSSPADDASALGRPPRRPGEFEIPAIARVNVPAAVAVKESVEVGNPALSPKLRLEVVVPATQAKERLPPHPWQIRPRSNPPAAVAHPSAPSRA